MKKVKKVAHWCSNRWRSLPVVLEHLLWQKTGAVGAAGPVGALVGAGIGAKVVDLLLLEQGGLLRAE